MKDELTIVIPCKNEERYINNCLQSIHNQTDIKDVNIFIADANSTDCTVDIIYAWKSKLNITLIEGGLPAIGRNRGAYLSNTEYVLFIDADTEFYDKNIIKDCLVKMKTEKLHLLSPKLNSNIFKVKFLYSITNFIIWLSKFDSPFSVGMFMMMNTEIFKSLNGFPEDVMHCEDYLLSKKVKKDKFGIINKSIYTDDRRFRKMGYFKMIPYIFKNIVNRNNYDFFKKDINYWA